MTVTSRTSEVYKMFCVKSSFVAPLEEKALGTASLNGIKAKQKVK